MTLTWCKSNLRMIGLEVALSLALLTENAVFLYVDVIWILEANLY